MVVPAHVGNGGGTPCAIPGGAISARQRRECSLADGAAGDAESGRRFPCSCCVSPVQTQLHGRRCSRMQPASTEHSSRLHRDVHLATCIGGEADASAAKSLRRYVTGARVAARTAARRR